MTTARILVLCGLLGAAACGGSSEAPAPPKSDASATATPEKHADPSEVRIEEGMMRDLRLTTAKVESRRGDDVATLLGELTVDERRYAEVGVPVAARVARLLANLGDEVKAGQSLVQLQSQEVGRARSEYLRAFSRLGLAESVLKRKQTLAVERIAPRREVQEAEADVAAARAEVRAATAGLNALGLPKPAEGDPETVASSTFTLSTPVAGTVISRAAVLGQMLAPERPAFLVADLSTLWLTVHAFERDAVRIQKGTNARVTFAAVPGEEFRGQVTLIGSQVSSESRTVDVRIDVRNRRNVLRPGMSAAAALPIGVSALPVTAVPVAAVQRVGDNWCVFIPKANGVFEIRKIGRGRDLGSEVEILTGLSVGDTIVVDGAFLLKSQAEKRADGHGGH